MSEVEPSNSTVVIHPPPFAINSEDKSGLIVVVTTFCLVSVWILFFIRVYIRLRIVKAWKLDDTFVAIATVLSTVRSAVVYVEVRNGYGKSAASHADGAAISIGKAIFADVILFLIAMFFSKCAVLLLCQRMTPKKEHWYAIGAVFVLAAIWAVVSVLLVSVACGRVDSWQDVLERCPDLPSRWKAITSLDISTEFLIFLCLLYLVWGLHMSWMLKGLVLVAFCIRLPTAIFSGLHLRSILKEFNASDPSLAGAVTLVWRQFELDFAITACTFASLGAFLKPFDNKQMGPSRTDSHHMGSSRFPGNSMRSRHLSQQDQSRPTPKESIDLPILRPDRGETTAEVMTTSQKSDRLSIESNNSRKGIIMQKQWVVVDDNKDT